MELDIIPGGTTEFSRPKIFNVVNVAAKMAAIEGFSGAALSQLEHLKDKILIGEERRSVMLSEETRRTTSYHERGYALFCLFDNYALLVRNTTIMPRGQALGMVAQLPDKDMTSMSKAQMLAKLTVCMGGRAAEELIFGEGKVTSGASSDFQQATELAEAMVTQYGMSERLGRVVYNKERESGETRALIEREVRQLLDRAYEQAMAILKDHQSELHRLATALLEHETLTGAQVQLAVRGKLGKLMADSNERKKVAVQEGKTSADGVPKEEGPATKQHKKQGGVIDAPNTVQNVPAARATGTAGGSA